jgi:hypothetical protein
MRTTSRLALLSVSVVAATGLFAGSASADALAYTDKFAARADAQAMTIDLFGTKITGSHSIADLDASPHGKATVSELILGGPMDSGEISAEVSGLTDTTAADKPDACFLDELEQIPGIARVDITGPEATAAIAGQLPTARALGAEVVLEPSVSTVLDTLGLQEPVQDGVNQVFEDVLNPLVEALTGNPIGDTADQAVSTVQDVLNDTLTLKSTARIVVAPALAEVTSDTEKVVAAAHSQGVRIELLPVDEAGATNGLLPDDLVPGEPLVTITIGEAKADCTFWRAGTPKGGTDGKKECPDGQASLVEIEFGSTALTDALGLSAEPITVDQGTEQCILVDTPLETCVSVATAGVDADGNPYANATSVNLFKGVNGGVNLAVGSVTSGSAGSPAAAALPAVSTPDLPRTGGNPALPVMGAGLLALAVLGRRIALGRA